MSEYVLAIGVTAICVDGVARNNVIMKSVNDEIVFVTPTGEHLCGHCQVKSLKNAKFVVPPRYIGLAIDKYRKQEASK